MSFKLQFKTPKHITFFLARLVVSPSNQDYRRPPHHANQLTTCRELTSLYLLIHLPNLKETTNFCPYLELKPRYTRDIVIGAMSRKSILDRVIAYAPAFTASDLIRQLPDYLILQTVSRQLIYYTDFLDQVSPSDLPTTHSRSAMVWHRVNFSPRLTHPPPGFS